MPSIDIEGKPRIYFSDNASDESWRLTEKLVAVIESYFQGRDDLYIFSSKRIRNVVGDPEEVDVAFADVADPRSSFSFVQIRNRENTEGRPWVEQVLGQRTTLGINAGIMVSTERFSQPAINVAKRYGIPLRLLLAETEEKIKTWYRPDTIGLHNPIVKIVRCSVLIRVDGKIVEFKADENKSLENNILLPTNQPNEYNVISLRRIFDVDVMQDKTRREELLAKTPRDGAFHKATAAIEYKHPRLYLKVDSSGASPTTSIKGIFPIEALVFFASVSHQFRNAPITHRYKYVDAIKNDCIAQAIVAEVDFEKGPNYICLVRHNIIGDNRNIGGAFFR